jgi:hypothetical protein
MPSETSKSYSIGRTGKDRVEDKKEEGISNQK